MKVPARFNKLEVLFNKLDPSKRVKFTSALHDPRVAAVLGVSLGIAFFTCFTTGLVSHFMQHPPGGFAWSSRPVNLYRFTQGLHVAAGLFAIPLLLAKLWVIYPKLFEWPPVSGVSHFLERASLPPLIGGGMFMVFTGLANISQWYFFDFFFTNAHYAVAYITIGALVVHIGAKATLTRELLLPDSQVETGQEEISVVAPVHGALTRRGFLAGVFGTGALVTLFTVGQSFSPLGSLALLSPRRPGVGKQGLPVNRTAVGAGVIEAAQSADYAMRIEGNVKQPLDLTLDQLRALPQTTATLPITCVEGWSASAKWRGISMPQLLEMAGAPKRCSVRVESLEQNGLYAQSLVKEHHTSDAMTLLALELNGEALDLDHGYPCRLIAPNRPGVMQTKWINKVVVL